MATAMCTECVWCQHQCKQYADYKTSFDAKKCTKEQNKMLKIINKQK